MKLMARIHGMPTTPLQDHVTRKTIGKNRGKLGVLSF